MIAGLLLPASGSVTVLKFDSAREAERIHAVIGYASEFGLYEISR